MPKTLNVCSATEIESFDSMINAVEIPRRRPAAVRAREDCQRLAEGSITDVSYGFDELAFAFSNNLTLKITSDHYIPKWVVQSSDLHVWNSKAKHDDRYILKFLGEQIIESEWNIARMNELCLGKNLIGLHPSGDWLFFEFSEGLDITLSIVMIKETQSPFIYYSIGEGSEIQE